MRKKADGKPERVNLAIKERTRYRLNGLKAEVSLARDEKMELDPLINLLIENYRATAPELRPDARRGEITMNVHPRDDGPAIRHVAVALETALLA